MSSEREKRLEEARDRPKKRFPPGPPDPPRLCRECDTRRYDHGVIHEPDCPSLKRTLATPEAPEEGGDPWEIEGLTRELWERLAPELRRIAQLAEPDPVPKSFHPVLTSHRATIREAAHSIERLRAEVARLSAARTPEEGGDLLEEMAIEVAPCFEGGLDEALLLVRHVATRLSAARTPTVSHLEAVPCWVEGTRGGGLVTLKAMSGVNAWREGEHVLVIPITDHPEEDDE